MAHRSADVARWRAKADGVREAMHRHSFNGTVYCDGMCADTAHTAWNANIFPLAFGLVPDEARKGVFEYVRDRAIPRNSSAASPADQKEQEKDDKLGDPSGVTPKPADGMPGNVYSSWFALEALFLSDWDGGAAGVELLLSTRTDSWLAMLAAGATTTMEAWTGREKPNLTWSHPWGASPVYAIPRRVLGIAPTEPGFSRLDIKPQLGSLTYASYTQPTIRGPVAVSAQRGTKGLSVSVSVPGNTVAAVHIAMQGGKGLCVDGAMVKGTAAGGYVAVDVHSGQHTVAAEC